MTTRKKFQCVFERSPFYIIEHSLIFVCTSRYTRGKLSLALF